MKFRDRKYAEEEVMQRQSVLEHPLIITSSHQHKIISMEQQDDATPSDPLSVNALPDPLGVTAAYDPLLAGSPGIVVTSRTSHQSTSTEKLDNEVESAGDEWEAYRISIMQRFTSNDTIRVLSNLDIISKRVKGRSLKASHLEELDDRIKSTNEEEIMSQEEYVTRLRELNDDIAHAWLKNERVAALRLAVKVTKLLSDTSVPKFYPTLFILVTDILETIGSLVWKRIKGKAEVNDNGQRIKILSNKFSSDDICQEAKDTCNNWFYKIGSIHELIPRIYLEISIMHCMRFLENEPPKSSFQRLVLMIRGITDPLAAAYARIYLARKGQTIMPRDTGYLMMGLDDYLLLFQKVLSGEINTSRSSLNKQAYASLMEPMFELYIHYICQSATKEELLFILRTFCDQQSGLCVNAEGTGPVSVVVYYLLKELPASLVASQAIDLSKIVKSSNDASKPQYMNYTLLGAKLCEYNPPEEIRLTVLNDIWKVVSKFSRLIEYLVVADVFIDYILQCCSETELHVLLRDIKKHLTKAEITDEALQILESIIIKVLIKISDLKHILDLPYFVDILDELLGDVKISVHKKILHHISRTNQHILDPVSQHFVFELSKSLYKSLDSMSSEDEQRQIARLISRSVQLVDFKHDLEEHLMFLVEWRGIFVNCDLLRETIVHVSNRIAVTMLSLAKGILTQHSMDFIKACLTFNEITIPSIRSVLKRSHLYIETAEVALMNGLVSHSESLLKSAIMCLEETQNPEGMEMQILGCVQKICSFLIVVPGDQEQGTFYLLRSLVQLTQRLLKESFRVQAILGVILACHALSQENLPYHTKAVEVISNDVLFAGESSYGEELGNFVIELVKNVFSNSTDIQGRDYEALLIFQAFAIAFECEEHDEIYNYCRDLFKAVEPSPLKYGNHMNSVINFYRDRFQVIEN